MTSPVTSMQEALDATIWSSLPSAPQKADVSGEGRQTNCTTPPRTRPAASASSPLLMTHTPSKKRSSKKEQVRLQRPVVSGETGLGSSFAQEVQALDMQEGLQAYYQQRIDTLSQELAEVNVLIPEMLDMPSLSQQPVQDTVIKRLMQHKRQLESMRTSLRREMPRERRFREDITTYYNKLHTDLRREWSDVEIHDTLLLNNFSRPCEATTQSQANMTDFLRLPHEDNSPLSLERCTQRKNVLETHTDPEVLQRLQGHATSMMHALRTQCCLRVTGVDHAPLVFTHPSVDQSLRRRHDFFSSPQAYYVEKDLSQGQLLHYNIGNRLQEAVSHLFAALRGLQQKPCIQVSVLKVRGRCLVKGLLVVVTMNTPKTLQYAKKNSPQASERSMALEALQRFQKQVEMLIACKQDVSVPILHLDMFTDIGMGTNVLLFAGRSVHAEMTFACIHQVIKKIFPTLRIENNTEASNSPRQAIALR